MLSSIRICNHVHFLMGFDPRGNSRVIVVKRFFSHGVFICRTIFFRGSDFGRPVSSVLGILDEIIEL